MKVNASSIVTPSGLRYRSAAPKRARGEVSCSARTPDGLAGERRKTRGSRSPVPMPQAITGDRLFHIPAIYGPQLPLVPMPTAEAATVIVQPMMLSGLPLPMVEYPASVTVKLWNCSSMGML